MAISAALVSALAGKLLEAYVDDDSIVKSVGDLILGRDDLAGALESLLEEGKLKVPVTKAADVTDDVIGKLIADIKEIQKNTGNFLEADGVLGQRTLRWLRSPRFGHYDRDKRSLPKSNTSLSPGDGIHALRYFIEGDELPHVPGVLPMRTLITFTEAWESWAKVCKINVKQTGNKADANVVVSMRVLNDRAASVVAIADVGPPGDRQLELVFDKAETWTINKLRATAAHEIGHILGLHHISAPKQLMNDTIQDDVLEPQTLDIDAVVKIWGAR